MFNVIQEPELKAHVVFEAYKFKQINTNIESTYTTHIHEYILRIDKTMYYISISIYEYEIGNVYSQ